jgi:hypothetical protein
MEFRILLDLGGGFGKLVNKVPPTVALNAFRRVDLEFNARSDMPLPDEVDSELIMK